MFGKKHKANWTSEHPYSHTPLLLASGMGRSGTTVLRHCLAAHPQIDCCNRECNYICELMATATHAMAHPNRQSNLVVSKADFWRMHQQMLLNLLWPLSAIGKTSESDPDPARPRAISTYSMIGPDSAQGLEQAFPRSAIIYIVRNGIEVVSSYISFDAFSHMSFEQVCSLWAHKYDMIEHCARNRNCFEFRYEWLRDPARVQQELQHPLKFVGLKFDEACLKPLSRKFHPTVFAGEQPADARSLDCRANRWQLWTKQQRITFVKHCRDRMVALGYTIPWL